MRKRKTWEESSGMWGLLYIVAHVLGCVLGYLLGDRLFGKEVINPFLLTLLYVVHYFVIPFVYEALSYVLNLFQPGLSNWTFWLGSGETV
jgi:antibiotic biosynthesis monooxygenase (ABM) superfamily enzyme